jgi:cysteine sulfinate desulfinase/cysteine desulfurase-like protein
MITAIQNTNEIETTRSTNAINAFVRASRLARRSAEELKKQESEMASNLADVLEQIGDGRAVYVDQVRAILTPRESVSVAMVDAESALEFWQEKGFKVSTRSEFYVAPASFRAEVIKGSVPSELYTLKTTRDVNVI